jgi:hypothetical protein
MHSAPGQELLTNHDNEFNKDKVRMTCNAKRSGSGVQESEDEPPSKRAKLNLLDMPPSLKGIDELKALHKDTVTIDAGCQAVLIVANKGTELYAYASAPTLVQVMVSGVQRPIS